MQLLKVKRETRDVVGRLRSRWARGRKEGKSENDCKVGYSLCTANSLNELQLTYAYVVVMGVRLNRKMRRKARNRLWQGSGTNVLFFFPLGGEQGRMEGS